MRNFSIAHILLFLIFMLAYQCAQAQDYLVTVRGDTVQGNVKPLTYSNEKKVQVTGSDRKKTVYPMTQIKSFSLEGETYQPVKGPNGYTFMRLIKDGYLSLYAYQLDNQVTYDGMYLLKKDGQGTEVPNLSFKKVLRNFLEDCSAVARQVDEGILTRKELHLIIDEYNKCINNKTNEQERVLARSTERTRKVGAWDTLEEKVKATSNFDSKEDALEMIAEIKNKISRAEKIPNFLIEGLKDALPQPEFKTDLDRAFQEIN